MELIINAPYLKRITGGVRMYADIEVNDKITQLYYETDENYGKYLTPELCDAFIVNLLLYAMENECDIICRGAASERLVYQIQNYLMPVISANIKKYKMISIKCDNLETLRFNGKAVGTGFSCGVDSFYTVLKNLEHTQSSELKLTHLFFCNAGGNGGMGGKLARQVFKMRNEHFSMVADELKLDYLYCDCNINEFLQQVHVSTHTFRTLAMVLAFQKLFSVYYFSSGYRADEFSVCLEDTGKYDILTLPNISNQNCRFVSVGSEVSRQGKVEYITRFDMPKKYLHVCLDNKNPSVVKNCSHCKKCKRTMLNLYFAGKLDEYSELFDIDYFYKNKENIILWALLEGNDKQTDMEEIATLLRAKGLVSYNNKIKFKIGICIRWIKRLIKKEIKLFTNEKY